MLDYIRREPVRTKLYPALVLVVALMATKGVIDEDAVRLFDALLTTVLGVSATEAARSKVSPVA